MLSDEIAIKFELIPSGVFAQCAVPIVSPTPEEVKTYYIRNPLFSSKDLDSEKLIDQVSPNEAKEFFEHYVKKDVRRINIPSIDNYADQLTKLGLSQNIRNAELILCPLRGGLKPGLHLELLSGIKNIKALPYTQGSSGKYDDAILSYLKDVIHEYNPKTIAIVDTAQGGQGSNHLAKLLIKFKTEFKASYTELIFHLLHTSDANLANINSLNKHSTSSVKISLSLYPVDNLLFEDWDLALGIKVDFDKESYDIKRSERSGKIIICSNINIQVIESNDLSVLTDRLLAKSLSESIESNPELYYLWDDPIFQNIRFNN